MTGELGQIPVELSVMGLNTSVRASNIALSEAIQAMRFLALAALAEAQDNREEMIKYHQQVVDELKKAGDHLAQSNLILSKITHEV